MNKQPRIKEFGLRVFVPREQLADLLEALAYDFGVRFELGVPERLDAPIGATDAIEEFAREVEAPRKIALPAPALSKRALPKQAGALSQQSSKTAQICLEALAKAGKPMAYHDLAKHIERAGFGQSATSYGLSVLTKNGLVRRVSAGVYALSGNAAKLPAAEDAAQEAPQTAVTKHYREYEDRIVAALQAHEGQPIMRRDLLKELGLVERHWIFDVSAARLRSAGRIKPGLERGTYELAE